MFVIRTKRRRGIGRKGILFAAFVFAIFIGISFAFINDGKNYSRITWESESEKTNVSVKADDLAFATDVKMNVDRVSDSSVLKIAQNAARQYSNDILAFNISFLDHNGEEIQPNSRVKVTLQPQEYNLNAERYALVHIDDNNKADYLGNIAASSTGEISFYAERFSIYAIIPTEDTTETKYARETYEFYVDNNLVATQTVRDGDILNAPAAPSKNELIFMGWYTDSNKVFNGLNLAVNIPDGTTSDKTIVLHGVFADKIYSVIFYNNEGNVLATKSGTSGDVINTYDMRYEVSAGNFVDAWTLDKNQSGFIEDGVIVDEVGETVTIDHSNIKLYPVIRSVKWAFYHTNDEDEDLKTPSSYVAAGYAFYGHLLEKPTDPTRTGYDFMGWATDPDGTEMFDFTAPMTSDVNLYAIWRPHTNTPYRIVVWKEALLDGKYVEGNYDFAVYVDGTATSGSTVNISQSQIDTILSRDDLVYYEYDRADQDVVVHGDGSSILNAYLKMKVYTVNFTVETRSGNNYVFNYYSANGRQTTDSQRTSFATNGRLSVDYTNPAGDTMSLLNGYSFTARIGEDISDRWPAPFEINLVYSQNANVKAYTWHALNDNPSNTNRVTKQTYMTNDLLLSDYSDGATYYLVGSAYLQQITARYWFENADGSGYTVDDRLTFTGSIGRNGALSAREIPGYEVLDSTPSGYQGSSGNNYNFYYNRLKHSLYFYNYNTPGNSYVGTVGQGVSIKSYDYEPPRPNGLSSAYTFQGWYTEANCYDGSKFDFDTHVMPDSDLMLYAKWENTSYITLSFNTNGGNPIPSQSILYGTQAHAVDNPVREGYTFIGWRKTDGSFFSFDAILIEDTELVASWVPFDVIYVDYDANGGEIAITDEETYVDTSTTAILPEPSAAPEGKYFVGWNVNGRIYYPGNIVMILLSDIHDGGNTITITAEWGKSVDKTSITYSANTGIGNDITEELEQNVAFTTKTAAEAGYSKPGYTLKGWNSAADGSGVFYALGTQWAADNRAALPNILYAQWDANPAVISYNANGGVGTMADTTGVTDQEVTLRNNTFTRGGYTFMGWNTIADGSGVSYADGASLLMPAGTTILYAEWAADSASIVYNANGGTGFMPSTDGVTDEVVTISNNTFTLHGYTFTGWNTKADGTGTSYAEGAEYTLLSTVTVLYAQWAPDAAVIIYNANGGMGSMPNTEGVTDEVVQIAANTFVRAGYTFTGWNTKADGTGVGYLEGRDFTLTESATILYAQWSADHASISYDTNGGTGIMFDTEGVTDEVVQIYTNTFTRDGYTFTGWNTAADGSGTSYANGANFTLLPGTTILYAQWSANPSVLIYNANGGIGTMPSTTGVTDQIVTISTHAFTRNGYTFTGWNTKADGTGDSYVDGANFTLQVGEAALYAQWSANPSNISYDANGGTGTMADTTGVTDQTVQIATNTFTRDGYTFTGWNTKADGTGASYSEGADYVLTPDNLVLYAQWRANPSKIIYNANGGTGAMADTTGVTDEVVQISTNTFTRAGYTFTGWNTKADGSGTDYSEGANYTLTADDLTLYAQWQANPSKIVYNANGGTGTMADTTGVTDQTVQIATNGFSRTGYTFTGWNTKADGSGASYSEGDNYTLTADTLTLYAQWQANPSKIVYNANGGTGTMADTTGVTDQTVQISANDFTRAGYTFTGWNTKADGTGTDYAEGADYVLTSNDLTLYAQWSANPSKIVYNANGGTGTMADTTGVTDQTVQIATNTFTRDGYTFTGWNTKADGTGASYSEGADYVLTANDLTLYAQWSADASKVTYLPNGGTGTMADTTGVTGQTIQIAANTFTRAGYTFTGWNTKADGTGTSYTEGADYVLTSNNLTLYAQWSANPSKIVYNANGGTGTMADTTGVTDQTVQIATNSFTRDGYTFTGWNTKADGSGTSYAEGDDFVLVSDSTILYAQWQANPSKIVYDANGGTGTMVDTIGVTDEVVQISTNTFTRDGYVFTGWNTKADGSGTNYSEGADYTLTANDLTLYAQWSANASKIVYNANGGNGIMADTEGVTDQIVQIATNTFTRDGYTFTGWNTKADGSGTSYSEGDDFALLSTPTILYAQWQANPSKITYNANGGAGTMADTTGVTDQTVQIATNTFTRAGYTFTGWNTKANGTGTDYSEEANYVLTPNDLTLYAQWSANPSRIVYNANGGTGSMPNTEGVTDEVVQISANTFTRDGYTFTGWNTKADGSGTSYSEGDDFALVPDSATLYAQWEKIEEIPEAPATPDTILEITSICMTSMAVIGVLLFILSRRRRI